MRSKGNLYHPCTKGLALAVHLLFPQASAASVPVCLSFICNKEVEEKGRGAAGSWRKDRGLEMKGKL